MFTSFLRGEVGGSGLPQRLARGNSLRAGLGRAAKLGRPEAVKTSHSCLAISFQLSGCHCGVWGHGQDWGGRWSGSGQTPLLADTERQPECAAYLLGSRGGLL